MAIASELMLSVRTVESHEPLCKNRMPQPIGARDLAMTRPMQS